MLDGQSTRFFKSRNEDSVPFLPFYKYNIQKVEYTIRMKTYECDSTKRSSFIDLFYATTVELFSRSVSVGIKDEKQD